MTLAQKLGYAADARLLIVNCDDIGSSHAANIASEAALRHGLATSATLMVPCPWAREAVERFGDLDVGVHLTLTSEYPSYRWRSLTGAPSLRDDQGFLPRTAGALWKQADPIDVEAECRAQIDQALAWGVDVTHLDNHMGTLQLSERLFPIYVKLAREYQLPLRMAGKSGDAKLGFGGRAQCDAAGVLYPDHFGFQWGTKTADVFARLLEVPRAGVLETVLHPVQPGEELDAYDPKEKWIREHDAAVGVDDVLRTKLDAAGIERISFRPLRDAMRARI
jgi:hypothetical protein